MRLSDARSTAACALLLAAGCSGRDGPTAPASGYVRVSALTSGGDLDLDGYRFHVDSKQSVPIGSSVRPTSTTINVEPGTHTITLDDVATNCRVAGGLTKPVTVGENALVDVAFDVECSVTGLTVSMSADGSDTPDSARVVLRLNGQQVTETYRVARSGSLQVGRLTPGAYSVALIVPDNCTAKSGAERDVPVLIGMVTAAPPFHIACVGVVRAPRIAYVSAATDRDAVLPFIETVKLDGSGRTQVALGDAPAWSPDGTKLGFSTMACLDAPWDYGDVYCEGGVELIDPETGNRTALRAGTGGFRPAFTPSDSAIGFDRGGGVWVTSIATADAPARGVTPSSPSADSLQHPSWSPDGVRLAVTCTWSAKVDLCLVNRDGTRLVRLTNDVVENRDPAWSPDGRTIAFTRLGADPKSPRSSFVALYDLASGRVTLLATGSDPAWSPDGRKLAFAGADGIFIMNADGTSQTRLTSGSHSAPAWRP